MTKKKPTMPAGDVCGRCKHWDQVPNGRGDPAMGDCYGIPPTVLGVDNEGAVLQARSRLQSVERACGLFQPRIDA